MGGRAARAPPLDPPLNTHKLIIYLFLQPLALATPSRYLLRRGDIMQVVGGLQEPTEETKTQIEIYIHVSFQRFVTLGQKEKV